MWPCCSPLHRDKKQAGRRRTMGCLRSPCPAAIQTWRLRNVDLSPSLSFSPPLSLSGATSELSQRGVKCRRACRSLVLCAVMPSGFLWKNCVNILPRKKAKQRFQNGIRPRRKSEKNVSSHIDGGGLRALEWVCVCHCFGYRLGFTARPITGKENNSYSKAYSQTPWMAVNYCGVYHTSHMMS